MARVIVNKKELKGYVSASSKRDKEGNVIMIGELLTHKNIEEITSIETDRYIFESVTIVGFSIGSNDFFIKYDFECNEENLVFKGGESNLTKEVIDIVEADLFKNEVVELFHKKVGE